MNGKKDDPVQPYLITSFRRECHSKFNPPYPLVHPNVRNRRFPISTFQIQHRSAEKQFRFYKSNGTYN